MIRAAFALLSVVCLALAGCCMCAAPYDGCAPTFTGGCGCGEKCCRPHARLGSAFTGLCVPSAPVCACGACDGTLPEGQPGPTPYYEEGSTSRQQFTLPPSAYTTSHGRRIGR